MRIAYLEDDADQATLIRKWLEEAGHICHYFDRGHALQRSLARESFDLYILDWHLPDTDGLQVLKEIRTSVPAALVIFATARDRDDDIARGLQAGADDYITKPVRRASCSRASRPWHVACAASRPLPRSSNWRRSG